jgi:gluconokinase
MDETADNTPTIIILMGVSGSGKTTIGQHLARELSWPFFEGDQFHPPQNVAKMSAGTPLTDEDRRPWLDRLAQLIDDCLAHDQPAIIACSALKHRYRRQLRRADPRVRFVYLKGQYDTILQRMQQRPDHFMKPEMLRSQFDALEPPTGDEAITVSIEEDVATIVATIRDALKAAAT